MKKDFQGTSMAFLKVVEFVRIASTIRRASTVTSAYQDTTSLMTKNSMILMYVNHAIVIHSTILVIVLKDQGSVSVAQSIFHHIVMHAMMGIMIILTVSLVTATELVHLVVFVKWEVGSVHARIIMMD